MSCTDHFLLTNAFSEDGQKSLLRYYVVEDYFESYMKDAKEPSESFKYMSMLRAISYTGERRVSLPLVEGHHRSTTLFHLVCSAKVDTTEGKTVHNTLNQEAIESGLAKKTTRRWRK